MPNFGFRDMRTQAELLLAPRRPTSRSAMNLSSLKVKLGTTSIPGAITSAAHISGPLRKQLGDSITAKAKVKGIVGSLTKVLSNFDTQANALAGGNLPSQGLISVTSEDLPGVDDFLNFSSVNPGEPIPSSFKAAIAQRKAQLQQLSQALSKALTSGNITGGVKITENLTPTSYPRDDEFDLPSIPRLAQGGLAAKADSILKDKIRFVVRGVPIGSGKPASWSRFLTSAAIKATSSMNPVVNQLFKDRKNSSTWSEPVTPYAAQFPYNRVQQTEAGHVMEFDDTPGAERIHLFHRSGSFVEMHPDGTVVYKNVKDGYDLTLGGKYVKVGGSCHISVDGNATVHAKGNVDLQTEKEINIRAAEDFNVFAKNINLRAKRTFKADGIKMDLRYITLPSGIVPVPFTGMFAPRVNLAAVKADFPKGNFDTVTKSWAKMPLDPRSVPSLSLGSTESVTAPVESPLSNYSVYEKTTPQAVAYRTRMFDTPEEVEDLELYNAHHQLRTVLKDTKKSTAVLGGALVAGTSTLDANTAAIVFLDYEDFKGNYTYANNYVLANTTFTLGDVVDLSLYPTMLKDINAAKNTFEGVPTEVTIDTEPDGPVTGGGDHEDYRDAWFASGGTTATQLLIFNDAHPELGGTVFGSKSSKVKFADGAAFQAVRSAGIDGGIGAVWDRL